MSMEKKWELKKFVAPEIIFGLGAVDLAGQYAANLGARKVLLVTDRGVIAAKWAERVGESVDAAGLSCVVFSDVSPNPRDHEVDEGAALYKKHGCNAIVAVGGGSPLDCAKAIGIVASNGGDINRYEGVDNVAYPIPPLICIPTTAGSSADVSQFTIITDTKRKVKMAIASKTIVPDIALIDPQTLTTMPGYLTACTGVDALAHAIEAYVSNVHWPLTDLHALEAIRLLHTYLPLSVNHPQDVNHRAQVMLASMEAGLAFSNAILGAVHALAHSLGGFSDLPHGECNAILLEHVVAANFSACPERYVAVGEAMGLKLRGLEETEQVEAIGHELARFRRELGLCRNLADLGIKAGDIPALAEYALQDVCMSTNPQKLSRREVEAIYERAL